MALRIFKVLLVLSLVRLSKQHVHGAVAQGDSQQMSTCGSNLLDGASCLESDSVALLQQVTRAGVSGEAVFLVGNGVLTEQQRDMLINAPAHKVYRFNGMPGLRRSEPVGNVFVRSFSGAAGGYWGLSCCNTQNASCSSAKASTMCSRISEALSVILLGGTSNKAIDFVRSCNDAVPFASQILDTEVVHLDGRKRVSPSGYLYGWSSGFLGFVHLRTAHPHDDIHIMGMNWASAIKRQPHPFTVEHSIISETTGVSVRIHETGTNAYHDHNVAVCECSQTQVANSFVDERGIKTVASPVAGTCSHGGSLLQADLKVTTF